MPPALRRPSFVRRPRPASERSLERLVVRISIQVLLSSIGILVLVLLAWRLRLLLLLIAASLFVAALINPFVHVLMRRGLGRTSSTFVVYLVLVVVAAALGFVLVAPVYGSAVHFASDLPNLVRQAQQGRGPVGHLVTRLHLANYVDQHAAAFKSFITRLGKPALSVGKTVFSGIASVVTIAFVSFFIVLEVPKMVNGALRFLREEDAEEFRRISTMMSRQVTGFMLGDLATSVIAGLVVFVALRITGVPFASVLAIWVALVDFLPLVGGLLAGVPTVGVAFLHSVPAGIVTVIVFLVYQQIENHVLYPIVISRTVQLNPLAVLLAVLIGAEVGGILGSTFGAICGAIFAVPVAGSIQVGGGELLKARLGDPGEAKGQQ
ncbi:MAG TPA: AI-2E family transporter [Acidimicrobiales bacterium]|nr:AI-2E family transporter [Acidimicrobiales bacterium]